MKKIGIITLHRAANYGAVLQSYSLISYLRRRITDASFEIIDYSTSAESRYYTKRYVSYLLKRMDFKSALGEYKKKKIFNDFANSLPVSDLRIKSDSIGELNSYINNNYDVVISGSDAIFNWNGLHFPTAYFLHDIIKKKMTYAASAHHLFYRGQEFDRLKYVKESLDSLDYFGVRDSETEKFAGFCGFQGNIHHNCDPALLLDINSIHNKVDKNSILYKCKIFDKRPIIVLMTPDTVVGKVIKDKFEKEYNIVSVFVKNGMFNNTVYSLTPFEWATLFSMAELTVTEYFHGTILSLLNGTAVLALDSLDDNLGYEGKIKDLLCSRLKLPNLYLNKRTISEQGSDVILSKIEEVIKTYDAKTVADNIEIEKRSSESFIKCLNQLL